MSKLLRVHATLIVCTDEILLKSAVFHITEVHSTTITETQLYAWPLSPEPFDQDLAPIHSAATQYDKAHQTNPHATCKCDSVYHTKIWSDVSPYYYGEMAELVSDNLIWTSIYVCLCLCYPTFFPEYLHCSMDPSI